MLCTQDIIHFNEGTVIVFSIPPLGEWVENAMFKPN